MNRFWFSAACVLLQAQVAFAQHACQFYAQNPDTITVTDAQNIEMEVEVDFTNIGTSTWQNTGGVSNLQYIELRPVNSGGIVFDGPLYHTTWINRQRVGSFITAQQGVAPQQVGRFVFKVQVNGQALGLGTHDCYFRLYHTQGGYIYNWNYTRIRVVVTQASAPAPPPAPTPPPAPSPTPGPTVLDPRIQSVIVERTKLNATGSGSYVEMYDLKSSSTLEPIKKYQTLQLVGTVNNGTAMAHEWSVEANGVTRLLGSNQNMTTQPNDLFIGSQTLRYRVRDANNNWSSYATYVIQVNHWPQLFLPVSGSFIRSGNDYNQGDHDIPSQLWGQDWNAPSGGNTDFGLELVASISGTVTTGATTISGKSVNIEHQDPVTGTRYRAQYLHLSSVLVRDGQLVSVGQPIGLFGNTGSFSQGTHLHYTFCEWRNGAWISVAPEPCWVDAQTVRQTIRYGDTVQSTNRMLPAELMILSEQAVSAPNRDDWGYGHSKYWSATTPNLQPTSYATWDVIMPESGMWKLWMHNPSAVTQSNSGATTHNTTNRAVFEINRPRVLGLETHYVDQGAGIKGGLIEVCQMDMQAGDRLLIRQHNATGESGREISYDELVLTLEVRAGSGGGGGGTPVPIPSPPPSNPPAPSPPPSSPSNPPVSNPPPSYPPAPAPTGGSGGGGGGGCSMSADSRFSNGSWTAVALLILTSILCARRYRSSSPR